MPLSPPVSPPDAPATAPVPGGTLHAPERLPVIDALRGAAALGVLLFHSLGAFDSPGQLHPFLGGLWHLTDHGHLGVSIFFSLSGWCIAQRLQSAWRRREATWHFLGDRLLRIFPTYWAALFIAVALRLLAVPFRDTTVAANLPAGPRAWVADLLLLQPYLGTVAFVLVSWSLVYELGFYGVAALGLRARRFGAGSIWLVAAGLLVCFCPDPGFTFRGSFLWYRWPDFFCGAFAWWIARHATGGRRLAWGALLVLIGLASPAGPLDPVRLTAVATALLLLLCADFSPPVPAAFLRPLAWVGVFSYSLYLIHIPVLSPFINLATRFVSPRQPWFIAVWAAAVVLALGAGWLLHHGIEAPLEKWRRRLPLR